jgi:hypothetical protein
MPEHPQHATVTLLQLAREIGRINQEDVHLSVQGGSMYRKIAKYAASVWTN